MKPEEIAEIVERLIEWSHADIPLRPNGADKVAFRRAAAIVEAASKAEEALLEISARAGYRVPDEPLEVSSSRLGAPHQRRRLFWIADTYGSRLAMPWASGPCEIEASARRTADGDPWLQALGGTWRVDDGIPGGMDRRKRIECLGNAVVPAVAEWIALALIRSIESHEKGRR